MKELPFDAEYVDEVLEGRKTATVRKGWYRDIEEGEEVAGVSAGGLAFGRLYIKKKFEAVVMNALIYITLSGGKYGADNAIELREGLEKHYDDISMTTKVTVYIFEVVNYD